MTDTKQLSAARIKEMTALLQALTASAQTVVDSWERGDLAGAVNALEADASDAAEFLEWLATH